MQRIAIPTYFLSASSSFVMMDAFMQALYFKAMMMSLPFTFFLSLGSYLTHQGSILISRIDLIGDEDDGVAEKVIVNNLRGEQETVNITDFKALKSEQAKKFIVQSQVKVVFPVFVTDLLMIIDKNGAISNTELFKAVVNGY